MQDGPIPVINCEHHVFLTFFHLEAKVSGCVDVLDCQEDEGDDVLKGHLFVDVDGYGGVKLGSLLRGPITPYVNEISISEQNKESCT